MKRKELYNYIREEIVNELTEMDVDKTSGSVVVKKGTSASDIKKYTTQGIDVSVVEADIDEMARKAGGYRVGDTSKFSEAKDLYNTGLYAEILKAIEEAGENGLTQKELGVKLGLKNDSILNGPLNKFKVIGVLGGGKLEAAPKPEKPSKEEPAEEPTEEPVDTYYKDDEEKAPEEKPEVDKEVEKTVGKTYADLSPEEEDVYTRFRQAIINKAKVLRDKKSSSDEKSKAKAAIDSYKTKADLKKLFLKKGLSLIDFISDELNK